MSDYQQRKQCPFAFNNPALAHNLRCLEDQCMAWKPALPEDKMAGDPWNALVEYVEIDRNFPHDIAENFCKDAARGYCKLIERGL